MADLTVTAAKVAAIDPQHSEIVPAIAGAAIAAGQSCYIDSNGKAQLTDADALASTECKGLALQTVGAGQAVDLLKRGPLEGATITQAYGAPIFISVTPGALADAQPAAGDFRFVIGRIMPMTDKDLTKVLWVDIDYAAEPTAL